MKPVTRALLIASAGLAVLLGAWTAARLWRVEPPADLAAGGASAVPIGGPFRLIDASGATVTDASFRGKLMVVYFGYTHCPDLCPTTLDKMARALRRVGTGADRVAMIFITVDPKRDTPKVMGDYVKAFDPRIVGLTGSSAEIAAAAKAYHVYYDASGPNDAELDHSSLVYFMGPDGKFAGFLSPDKTVDEFAAKIRDLLGKTQARTS